MDIKNIILTLIIGFIIFEVIEHLLVPIIFCFLKNRKKSFTAAESMLGEIVEVTQWKEVEGQVIGGELWETGNTLQKGFSDPGEKYVLLPHR